VLCPPFIMVVGILKLVNIDRLPMIVYAALVLLVAAGNALWLMLVTETIRVSLANVKRGTLNLTSARRRLKLF
jgi:hypothetical protein